MHKGELLLENAAGGSEHVFNHICLWTRCRAQQTIELPVEPTASVRNLEDVILLAGPAHRRPGKADRAIALERGENNKQRN